MVLFVSLAQDRFVLLENSRRRRPGAIHGRTNLAEGNGRPKRLYGPKRWAPLAIDQIEDLDPDAKDISTEPVHIRTDSDVARALWAPYRRANTAHGDLPYGTTACYSRLISTRALVRKGIG